MEWLILEDIGFYTSFPMLELMNGLVLGIFKHKGGSGDKSID